MGAYDVFIFKLQGYFNNAEKNLALSQNEIQYSGPSFPQITSSVIYQNITLCTLPRRRYAHLYISIFCNRYLHRNSICMYTTNFYVKHHYWMRATRAHP